MAKFKLEQNTLITPSNAKLAYVRGNEIQPLVMPNWEL